MIGPQQAGGATDDSAQVKACCADFYQHDLVTLLLDDYHPGGRRLTRRLAQLLGLRAGQRILDLACGRGTTALLLAEEQGAEVVGVDIGVGNLALARTRGVERGLGHRIHLLAADSELLPLKEASVDAVICECALCTFPDKPAAAAEVARVLRPGGRLGLADVTVDHDRLDPRLRTLAARVACIADARPVEGYRQLLKDAGLQVEIVERHDAALSEMIEQIDLRLTVLNMLARSFGIDFRSVHEAIRQAERAVREGHAGYVLIVATKPRIS